MLFCWPWKLLSLNLHYKFLCMECWLDVFGFPGGDLRIIWVYRWAAFVSLALTTHLFLILSLLSESYIFLHHNLIFLRWTAPHYRRRPLLLCCHGDLFDVIYKITVGFPEHGPLFLQQALCLLFGLHFFVLIYF